MIRTRAFSAARRRSALAIGAALLTAVATVAWADEPRHGISVFGDLKYGPDFERFEYTSPDAVKGGRVTQATIGTFDNTNPFVLKGVAAAGAGGIYDTLAVDFAGRAVRGLRALGRDHRGGRRQGRGHLPPAPRGSLPRRRARDGRGRRLDVRHADERGPSVLPQLLRRGRECRGARRAHRQVHLQGDGQRGAAADRQPARGAAEALLGRSGVRAARRSTLCSAAARTASAASTRAAR